MIPIPYRKFRLETLLNSDEVASRFQHNIEKDKIAKFIAGEPTRHFEGQLKYDHANNQYAFELYRLDGLKHLPLGVHGMIAEAEGKTHVVMWIKLHLLHILYLMIWLGFLILAITGQLLSGDFAWFIPVIFFSGVLYFIFRYVPEARKNVILIMNITQGEIITDKVQ